jgi:hypothetical protein
MKQLLFSIFLFTSKIIAYGQNCECGEGIGSYGDKPAFIYEFANSKSISFCGSVHNMKPDSSFHASEFSVFTCSDGEQLASYSAIQSCQVSVKNDSVFIDRIIYLYNGHGNKWKAYSLSRKDIFPKNNKIETSEEKVILLIPDINLVDEKAVLATDFKSMNKEDDQISDFLAKLEILVLNQNQKAVELLFSKQLEKATNAATTEHLYNIRETYNWVIKGIKNESYWW